MALVFLYFGILQVYSPDIWAGFVPESLTNFSLSANNLVVLNGSLEIILGGFLLLGLYTRFSALVLSLHLFGISFSLGFTPLGIRDFGLAAATLAVFFNKTDTYCLDQKFVRQKPIGTV